MILYCTGYKIRVEEIILFPKKIVRAAFLFRAQLDQIVNRYHTSVNNVQLANQLGCLAVLLGKDEADKTTQLLGEMSALDRGLSDHAKWIHWSDIENVDGFCVGNYRAKLSGEQETEYVHDGSDSLIVREGVDGPPHKVKIGAIDMLEVRKMVVKR